MEENREGQATDKAKTRGSREGGSLDESPPSSVVASGAAVGAGVAPLDVVVTLVMTTDTPAALAIAVGDAVGLHMARLKKHSSNSHMPHTPGPAQITMTQGKGRM